METVETDFGDDELMLLYRDGDADAFDVLFDRHYRTVYNFAWHLLHDPTEALDVLQETFLVVAHKTSAYHPRGHFKSWLLRICRNRCLNIAAKRKLRNAIARESGWEIMACVYTAAAPDETVARDEHVALVMDRMKTLPARQREAMLLYAFEDMKYRDIADVLEMPVNTVKTLIHRARQILAGALNGGT